MFKFLNKPYPFNNDLQHNAKIILFISLGVLIFLIFFQPIEIGTLAKREILYLAAGLTATTFMTLTLNLIILPSSISKQFDSTKWNIKREIIWNLWNVLAISGGYVLFYNKMFEIIDINFIDIVKILFLSLLPVSILITINQYRLIRLNLRTAQQLNSKLLEFKQRKEKLVHFDSDYKTDHLVVKADALILVKSSDNYIEVYFESGDTVKKKLVRWSLKKADETMREFDHFFRCHRSYIININKINEITGSSQGYNLYFEKIDFSVSVSQRYIGEFRKMGIFRP